ncbi:hypothetical protein [Parafilimonas sp.]
MVIVYVLQWLVQRVIVIAGGDRTKLRGEDAPQSSMPKVLNIYKALGQ